MSDDGRTLYVIVSAAGIASDVGQLVTLAQADGWTVQVIATPSAMPFIDAEALEAQTGRPVRSRYRAPGDPRPPRATAIVVAPATFNTINKFAQGHAENYALGLLAEAPGLGIPVVVLPCVQTALASRIPFRASVDQLRAEGIRVLFGPGEFEPHEPGALTDFPWHLAVEALRQETA
ncbi:flavoprotein [Actinoplanes lobatus]|uniref:Flavoprotein n=1 Tax=Actinoplanes lobatus TaxID=113568 RepID=A0A7W7MIK1_9ACTN|nr:flavoprotein [Actinoplanes lobatus]MBB4751065.1 phosphopantothenoylcysteine synthetase/decarboxylase [Actinoplanes lobatus]GGN92663.1 flavoprotein [Actinoplanes lobatus]GIE44944.1 flavoprotein [Actinoplanes lobatus]